MMKLKMIVVEQSIPHLLAAYPNDVFIKLVPDRSSELLRDLA